MNHNQFQEIVNLYIDGELDDSRSAEMFAHLSACSECRNLIRSSLRVRTYYQQMELQEVSSSLDCRVLSSVGITPTKMARRNFLIPLWFTRISIPLPAAVSIVFLILFGSLLLSPILFVEPKPQIDKQAEIISKMPQELQQQLRLLR
jgi:anti-sigma factor RsiW